MKKVFIVMFENTNGFKYVFKVFRTEELAEKFIKETQSGNSFRLWIQEWEVSDAV